MKAVTYRETAASEGADPRNLIVFLEGAQQNSRWRPGPIIRKVLTPYGHLMAFDYPDGPFRAARIASSIAGHIIRAHRAGRTRVVYLGISLGGLMANDIMMELLLRRLRSERSGVVLVDAPSGVKDLVDKRARFTPYIPQLWTPKPLNRRVLGRGPLLPHETFADEEQARIWLMQTNAGREFPFLYLYGGQIPYIVRHDKPNKTVLSQAEMAFVQSSNDTVVERAAPWNWMAASGRDMPVFPVETANHADLLEHPSAWAPGIARGVEHVLSQF